MICPDCHDPLMADGIVECAKCGWVGTYRDGIPSYLSRRDMADPVLQEYLENYDQIAADDLVKSIQDERHLQYVALNMAEAVGPLEGLRVCDIGCGKGFLARELLRKRPKEVTVVDIAVAYLERFRDIPGLRRVIANAENLPYRGEFDLIVATDIMEHVLNVGSFLFCLNRALKPGGRAHVRVPLDENLLQYAPQLGCPYRFVHLRSFDKKMLRISFRGAGFEIRGFRLDGFWPSIPRDLWTRGPIRQRILALFQGMLPRILKDPMEVTRWPPWVVQAFLRPVTISVIAQKAIEVERR